MSDRLKRVLEFLNDEADNRGAAGSEMSDYEREPRECAEEVAAFAADYEKLRRAASRVIAAYGSDWPDWLRRELGALETALGDKGG